MFSKGDEHINDNDLHVGKYAGLAQSAARQSHNLKVASSNLAFRIIFIKFNLMFDTIPRYDTLGLYDKSL